MAEFDNSCRDAGIETQRVQQRSRLTFREQGSTMDVQTHSDLTEFEFALFAAILSAHQNRERIVACALAGGRVEFPLPGPGSLIKT